MSTYALLSRMKATNKEILCYAMLCYAMLCYSSFFLTYRLGVGVLLTDCLGVG